MKNKKLNLGPVLAAVGALWLVVGGCAPEQPGASRQSGTRGKVETPALAMTKAQWWAKLEENDLKFPGNRAVVNIPKDRFIRAMGEPDATQVVSDKVFWYYDCADGRIQMVMSETFLSMYGKIATDAINEY